MRALPAMGSLVIVQLVCNAEEQCAKAFAAVADTLNDIENKMTLYRPSELTRVNDAAGTESIVVSNETFQVTSAAIAVSRLSDGYFDPTVSPALDVYRLYTTQPGNKVAEVPAETLMKIATFVDYRQVRLNPRSRSIALGLKGMKLDFGGIAKGYALDQIAMRLAALSVRSFSLNFGGHLLVQAMDHESTVPHPETGQPVLHCRLRNGSLSASAQNQRFVMGGQHRVGHIFNPRSLRERAPSERIVLVYHPSATTADAWSTALFFPKPDDFIKLSQRNGLHAMRLEARGNWLLSMKAAQNPVCRPVGS
jgi:thiamine biosynthesis lipoprotein